MMLWLVSDGQAIVLQGTALQTHYPGWIFQTDSSFHVQIYERSRFNKEIGAAVAIAPNSVSVLEKWRFDLEKAGAVENLQVRCKVLLRHPVHHAGLQDWT